MFNETSYNRHDGLSGAAGKAARKAAEAAAAAAQQPPGGTVGSAITPGQPAPAPSLGGSVLSGLGDFFSNMSVPVKIVAIAVLGIFLVKKR
jgi:hypothetical protein